MSCKITVGEFKNFIEDCNLKDEDILLFATNDPIEREFTGVLGYYNPEDTKVILEEQLDDEKIGEECKELIKENNMLKCVMFPIF